MFWGAIEESEKTNSRLQSNQGHLCLCSQCSTTELLQPVFHQPSQSSIHLYCTGDTEMPQLQTWQPRSMCCQNSVWDWPEKSLHQERTHAEWFSHSKCLELLPHVIVKRFWGGIRKIDYKYLHAASTRLLLAARRQQFGLSCNMGCYWSWTVLTCWVAASDRTHCVPFWQLHKIHRITTVWYDIC